MLHKIGGTCMCQYFSQVQNLQLKQQFDFSIEYNNFIIKRTMQFRVRPSSKKSTNNDHQIVQYPHKSFGQSSVPKALNNRIDTLESLLSSFQDLYRRDREQSNVSYIQIQKRLDKIQYKTFSTQQDLKQLSDIRQIKPIRQTYNSNAAYDTSKNQVMLLKQVILQDKEAQKENAKHQNSLIEQLSMKQLRTEQELRQIIAKQRMEYDHRLSGQGEEIRQIQGLKQRKMQQQYEMMKGVINNAERKIYEELQRKIRNQTVVKEFVQQKIADLKQQLSNEHKQTMSIEAKFIRQTKQSLQHLFGLINSLKRQLGDQLNETQKLAVNNIKRLSMGLDIARQKTTQQIKQISISQQEISNQLVELRNFMTSKLEQNRQIMSEFEQQAMERLTKGDYSKVGSNIQGTTVDSEKLSFLQKEIHQWKSLTEQKNLNVFKEISTTLKTMKLQWRKENDQMVSQIAALNQSLKNLKKSAPTELKKSVQAIITIFNNQFDVLAEQLQTLTEMIALSKKQTEKTNKEQLSKLHLDIIQQVKTMMVHRIKQSNSQTEKSISRSEETMKSFVHSQNKFLSDSLGQKVQKLQNQMSKLESLLKKSNLLTSAQLQDYSLKIKGFNDSYKQYLQQQRKQDLKKRVQLEDSMRKNASNLMDICYKKSEYLVDGLKNNIQIMQMKQKVQAQQALDFAKDQLKKQLQGARTQFQKDLSANQEKLTKQRQSSQEILHETMEQSINNAKRNLTNEMGNNKIELEEKINQMKIKQIQKDAANQTKLSQFKNQLIQTLQDQRKLNQQDLNRNKKQFEDKIALIQKAQKDKELQRDKQNIEMKNYLLQMIRDEKRLNQENIIKTRKQIDDKIALLQKGEQTKDIQLKERQSTNKQQLQKLIATSVASEKTKHQIQLNKLKTQINSKFDQNNTDNSAKMAKIESQMKAEVEKLMKNSAEDKIKEAEIQKLMNDLANEMKIKGKTTDDKIQQMNKKIVELKGNVQKETNKLGEQDKAKQIQVQKKISSLNAQNQAKSKNLNEKVQIIEKKLADIMKDTQIQKTKSAQQQKLKEGQIITKISNLELAMETTKKQGNQTTKKIEEINKKLVAVNAANQKDKSESKKVVGQQNLKQVKQDLQKSIKELETSISEMKAKDHDQQHQQAISNMRKSVNKLQAMVFSEQAKNKAMFDRLTQDVNKVSQNLTLLTNQIR